MAGIGKVIEISAGDSCCSFPHIEKSRFLQSATLTRGMHANKVKFAQTSKSVGAKKPRRQQRRGNHRLPVLAGLNPWLKVNLNGERFTNEASIPINDGSKLVSRRDSRRDKQKPPPPIKTLIAVVQGVLNRPLVEGLLALVRAICKTIAKHTKPKR